MKKAEIKINVTLDTTNVPQSITWESTDSQNKELMDAKAMMVAFWDQKRQNTLKIDLWTQDMPVFEMKRFFYETLVTMADTLERSTGEKAITEDLRDYCAHFAEKMELFQK